jgi:hypothetical protein
MATLPATATAAQALAVYSSAAAAGAVAGGAVAGAAGSIASQVVGVATGIQDKFSWNAVGLAAIGGGVSGGGVGQVTGSAIVNAAIANAVTQGIGVATGLQKEFSWAGVAAAGVGAGFANWVGARLPDIGDIAGRAVTGAAHAIASAATRSLIEGSDFGDNVMAALPDVIGQTIGEAIAGRLSGGGRATHEAQSDPAPRSAEPVLLESDATLGDYGDGWTILS